jgi:DNA-binding CsgD family transcriptional regulator
MTGSKPARARGPYDHLVVPAVLDASPDCIKIIGLDGRLKHMNRAGCLALGVDFDKVSGVDWIGLLPPQVHRAGFRSLRDAAQGGDVRFDGLSGSEGSDLRQWDNILTPLRDSAGRVENILCISRDVTGRDRPDPLLSPDETVLPPSSRPMLREWSRQARLGADQSFDLDHEPLSFRERECLFWAGLGKTAWETSVILGRSRRTVEFHLANAVKKLRAANKYHAAMIALDNAMF